MLLDDIALNGYICVTAEQKQRVDKFIDESDSLRRFLLANLCATSQSESDLTTNEFLTPITTIASTTRSTPSPPPRPRKLSLNS